MHWNWFWLLFFQLSSKQIVCNKQRSKRCSRKSDWNSLDCFHTYPIIIGTQLVGEILSSICFFRIDDFQYACSSRCYGVLERMSETDRLTIQTTCGKKITFPVELKQLLVFIILQSSKSWGNSKTVVTTCLSCKNNRFLLGSNSNEKVTDGRMESITQPI